MKNQVFISVLSPSIRPEMMGIVAKCLSRQDIVPRFEWIIGTRKELKSKMVKNIKSNIKYTILEDPPKRRGDFWKLCGSWNNLYAHAKGELIVNIQDGIWFPADTLSRYWFHYQQNPKALISAIGHQYKDLDEYGKPINLVWSDPRWRGDVSFQEVPPSEMEMVMCSIPKQAILECGGIDEEYDTCNGAQEKEMCFRLRKLGWEFYVDYTIEYRAIHHPRLSEDWDKVYKEKTTPLFVRHMNELENGTRILNVDNILKYVLK